MNDRAGLGIEGIIREALVEHAVLNVKTYHMIGVTVAGVSIRNHLNHPGAEVAHEVSNVKTGDGMAQTVGHVGIALQIEIGRITDQTVAKLTHDVGIATERVT